MVFAGLMILGPGVENEALLVALMPLWSALSTLPAAALSAIGLGAGFRSCWMALLGGGSWVIAGALAWPLTSGMAPYTLAAFGVAQCLGALGFGHWLRRRAARGST